VESANDPGGDFPLQNLPLGVFRSRGALPHIGTAIGEEVLDLPIADAAGLLGRLSEKTTAALQSNSLNALMAAGQPAWHELREGIWNLLEQDAPALRDDEAARGRMLKHRDEVEMLMPAVIGDYTDFYASLHHATNVGSMFRPDNPLLPNYKSLPVGYHGRASSIVVSGHEVRRPHGQRKPDEAAPPEYSVSTLLDYELELGVFVGPGNALGKPIPMTKAVDNLFAGSGQRQELHHVGQPLGRHDGGARPVPHRRTAARRGRSRDPRVPEADRAHRTRPHRAGAVVVRGHA
jgi:fumarylacetoacetase